MKSISSLAACIVQ